MATTDTTPMEVDRIGVLRYRAHRHGLAAGPGDDVSPAELELLAVGVQDTGTDGGDWALRQRGVDAQAHADDLVVAWTLRGAPHLYRASDVDAVAVATAPWSEADAAKRIFDAAKPLKAAGMSVLDALREVADQMRDIVADPMVKGDVSAELTNRLPAPFLRDCRPCASTHVYENPFRLSALQAGLVLEPGTSPPVLTRRSGPRPHRFETLADRADRSFDVVRSYLHLWGPASPKDVAGFLDAPAKEVAAHWPEDVVEVDVTDVPRRGRNDRRWILTEDVDTLASAADLGSEAVALLGPYDPYLQLRDRELLVPDEPRRKDLWRVLGRPGGVVVDGEVVGTWRPRANRGRLRIALEPWTPLPRARRRLLDARAEDLAAHRGVAFDGIDEA